GESSVESLGTNEVGIEDAGAGEPPTDLRRDVAAGGHRRCAIGAATFSLTRSIALRVESLDRRKRRPASSCERARDSAAGAATRNRSSTPAGRLSRAW